LSLPKILCFISLLFSSNKGTSVDYGNTWGSFVSLKNVVCPQISVWYDRWSGIDADLIHIVYADTGSDDVFYRNLNAANSDTLSTEYTAFAGASTASGGAISISRMRGGNLICVGCIDAGTEIFSRKSTDVGANWSDIVAGYEANADQCIVMPGWDADTNDAMMFYYDSSATEISVKYYDDSANSWSETSLATSIVLPGTATTFGHMNATVDLTNSQNLICFWTAIDTANADLRVFAVTQSTQTETATNVVLNSTDDQGFCTIAIDQNNVWYVIYMGNSDGTEIYNDTLRFYYKTSVNSGTNWSSQIQLTSRLGYSYYIFSCPKIMKAAINTPVTEATPLIVPDNAFTTAVATLLPKYILNFAILCRCCQKTNRAFCPFWG